MTCQISFSPDKSITIEVGDRQASSRIVLHTFKLTTVMKHWQWRSAVVQTAFSHTCRRTKDGSSCRFAPRQDNFGTYRMIPEKFRKTTSRIGEPAGTHIPLLPQWLPPLDSNVLIAMFMSPTVHASFSKFGNCGRGSNQSYKSKL